MRLLLYGSIAVYHHAHVAHIVLDEVVPVGSVVSTEADIATRELQLIQTAVVDVSDLYHNEQYKIVAAKESIISEISK